jgi:hypothetical protein
MTHPTPDADTLVELAARVEAATAEQQPELLRLAFYACFGDPLAADFLSDRERPAWIERESRFFRMIDVEAFESAAMALVPEGWRWVMRQASPDKANPNEKGFFARLETADFESVTWGKGSDWLTEVIAGQDVFVWAATPALALTAACLRARAAAESAK